jgi:hypothetical protein
MKTILHPILCRIVYATALLGAILIGTPARATLVWNSDFESYASGSPVTVNSTGDNNTFSQTNSGGTYSSYATVSYVAQPGLWDLGADRAMQVTWANSTNVNNYITARIKQINLPSFGLNPTMVLSFDLQSKDNVLETFGVGVVDASGNTVQSYENSGYGGTLAGLRATYVANRSGSSITLPGSLGSVANNQSVLYYKQGGTYTALGSPHTITADFAGFSFYSEKTILANSSYSLAVDNMGVWTSVNDLVGSTNVLQLDFGTVNIPEPGICALLFAGAVVGCAALRRKRPVR